MAKCKVTRKWLNESYPCISVSYCGIQYLMTYRSPDYYTCGVYGWNCDAYSLSVDNQRVCITTGYRGMIDNFKNNNSYDLYREYDKKAEKIVHNRDLGCNEERQQLDDLLKEYLRKVVNMQATPPTRKARSCIRGLK